MADDGFDRALGRLTLGDDAPAKLMGLREHSAVAVFADRSYALFFRYLPGMDQGLGQHLQKITGSLRAGRLFLVLIGGAEKQQEILTGAQVGWGIKRRIGAMQLTDAGQLWLAPRTPADHPLALALKGLADGTSHPASDSGQEPLRQRLTAVVDENADGNRDLAAFAKRLRAVKPVVTVGLIGVCALMFGLTSLWGGTEYPPTLSRLGANLGAWSIGEGQIERLAASIFLHGSLTHLLMNMFGLWILGSFFERLLGPGRLLVLFCLSGLAGSLASAGMSAGTLSVGASGALWGMLGASAALAYLPLLELPGPLMQQLRRNTVVILVLNVLISFIPGIDLWAHLGGGLMGAALMASRLLSTGKDLNKMADKQSAGPRPGWIMVVALLVTGVTLAGLGMAVSHGHAWELVAEPEWTRRAVSDTGISMEVPKMLGERFEESVDGRRREYGIGNVRLDPITVAVAVAPGPTDLSDPEGFRTHFDELKEALAQQAPKNATRRGPARERNLGGVPTVDELFVFANGIRMYQYSQLRPGMFVQVAVFVFEDGPAVWLEQPERIIESLKSDKPLRTRA
jgi:membrane associated rhomboid family serine protease